MRYATLGDMCVKSVSGKISINLVSSEDDINRRHGLVYEKHHVALTFSELRSCVISGRRNVVFNPCIHFEISHGLPECPMKPAFAHQTRKGLRGHANRDSVRAVTNMHAYL